ncbi:MAG: UDP-N-acetylglucosamine 1-carboxyvinyltransferase, partial [Pseudomonadota bacterium]
APKGGLAGGRIKLAFPSVGATENALMAATLARGESIIEQAACEPEIEDLARFLQAIGAKIEGAGTSRITVQGHHNLGGAHHRVIADRIEVGSLLIAAAATGGQIRVSSCNPDHLDCVLAELQKANCTIHSTDDEITLKAGDRFEAQTIETQPFPGYPTDLQAQFMALMTQANGTSVIHETLFENRFMHVPELVRLGANITIKDRKAMVEGPTSLKGAPVMATDLRASMSLVIAGLVASGVTQIRRIYHLDRGYERLHTKLVALGADITRKPDQEGGL